MKCKTEKKYYIKIFFYKKNDTLFRTIEVEIKYHFSYLKVIK